MSGSVPALTVGVPVYNGGRYLAPTVESILSQSFGDFEMIISDNASDDETESVAREFAKRDPRVRYHRHPRNVGLSANFNGLFFMARGRCFKWAAADDLCLPGYLEGCMAVLDARPEVVLAYPRTRFIDGEGNPVEANDPGWHLVDDDPARRLRYVVRSGHLVNAILGVIRSSALSKTRLLPRYPGGDYRLLAELCLEGKFVELPETLYVRRFHQRSSKIGGADRGWILNYWRGRPGGLVFPYWSLCADHFRIIVGSGLPLRDRFSLGAFLLRVMFWRKDRLWGEIRAAMPSSHAKPGRRPGAGES